MLLSQAWASSDCESACALSGIGQDPIKCEIGPLSLKVSQFDMVPLSDPRPILFDIACAPRILGHLPRASFHMQDRSYNFEPTPNARIPMKG